MFEETRAMVMYLKKVSLQTFYEERIAITVLLIVSVFATNFVFSSRSAMASTYNCYNYQNRQQHCYGIVLWTDNDTFPPVNGSKTYIVIRGMSCNPPACVYNRPDGTSDFIDNEMWLSDQTHKASLCPLYGNCWVEAGYMSRPNSNGQGSTESYFWGDYRPHDNMFNFHLLNPIPSGDFGHSTDFEIYRVPNNNFNVLIISQGVDYQLVSANNIMIPDQIQIGQEIQGTGGEGALEAYYTLNVWVDTNSQDHFQTNAGYVPPPYPPGSPTVYGWQYPPVSGNQGGTFTTHCGC